MKNGKPAGSLGLVSEMVKLAAEAGIPMTTDQINKIIVERISRADWKLSIILIYFME